MPQIKKIAIIIKGLGRKGLQFLETLTQANKKDVSQQQVYLAQKYNKINVMKLSNHQNSAHLSISWMCMQKNGFIDFDK